MSLMLYCISKDDPKNTSPLQKFTAVVCVSMAGPKKGQYSKVSAMLYCISKASPRKNDATAKFHPYRTELPKPALETCRNSNISLLLYCIFKAGPRKMSTP